MAGGSDPVTAASQAHAAAAGLVARQATMMSFVSVFRLLGLTFLLMLPLLLVMRAPRRPPGGGDLALH